MSRHFLTNINLNKNELQNAAIQALGQDPLNPTQGQIYFSTVTNSLRQWTGSDWIDYLNSADGSNYIESVDGNFTVDTQQLHLADDVTIDSSLTIGGAAITGPTNTDGTLTVKNSSDNPIFEVNATNNEVTFYNSSGTAVANTEVSGTGTFRIVSNDDLALRATSGDIILYPGEKNGNTGKAFVGWGNAVTGQAYGEVGLDNEITTAGNTQDLTNKTIADVTVYGKTSFKDATSGDTEYLSIEQAYTGTARFVAPDDISIRSTGGDIILYPGNDDGGTGKAYVHWGSDAMDAGAQNEITTAGNTQNLSNKTVTDELGFGSVPETSSFIAQSGMDDASLVVAAYQDLNLQAYNGNIILAASGASYIGSVNAENEVATKHYVDTVAQGLQIVAAVVAGSTASVDLSGTVTTVGGVTLANGDRVLIKNQVDATENGIYIYNSGTSMLEASTALDDTNLTEGHYVLVTQGTLAATGWIVSQYSAGATTWTQFSAANEYHAGTNIDITDNTISIDGIIAVTNGGTGADNAADARANLGATTKYAENNESLTPITGQVTWVVTHNLDTTDVVVQVKDISSATLVEVDVEITNSNSVTVSWVASTIVNADSYRVVVVG